MDANEQSRQQQSQIIANIENSINYELDDDGCSYSQISFKQHLRHDEGSLHNHYDNTSISTTNTSATTRNLAGGDNDSNFLRMIPGGIEEVHEAEDDEKKRSRQKSLFIENSDILNDQNYPKLYYRHSSTFLLPTTASQPSDEADKAHQKEKRRYSDTKLLNSLHFENEFLVKHDEHILGPPTYDEFGDVIFDQLEVNIKNILDLDNEQKSTQVLISEKKESLSEKRNIFQSLPNLELS